MVQSLLLVKEAEAADLGTQLVELELNCAKFDPFWGRRCWKKLRNSSDLMLLEDIWVFGDVYVLRMRDVVFILAGTYLCV